ncbi:relaxase/mobilization nuclease domain-containing protein [Maribellus comscasis]|uniref:Relaxase/mobilization nuclease domain-containing protein n=1 Tax=Maribellus comscasis TaxID=2681766 RepID=A0A6I6K3C3_9BACT|nr:relaxase/mobilization nuclease domain-containing protein [Maribellus comscasis]QGY46083.1 relaxase/mobilization nuclease domain-containing protein [Maribellus comscasis]
MVIVIHQSLNTQNALFYNEKKVERKKAFFFQSGNTPTINPFAGSKQDRWNILKEIEDRNTRVKQKGLHISVNPTVTDLVKLGNTGIRTEIRNLIEHLGYGNQPYFVYKHADLERTHFHIVSTRIDQQTGKKIRDNYEKEKAQRFIKGLEQKYQLTKDEPKEKLNYRFSGSSKNLKQNLERLFGQLNRMEFITSEEMYDQALKLFNVEVRSLGKGYATFVTDDAGNPVRYPIRLSEFKERPGFYLDNILSYAQEGNLNRKVQFPENFKRELLKSLFYQLKNERHEQNVERNKRKNLKYGKRNRY